MKQDEAIQGSEVRPVTARDCASQWGNDGLDVLSTPAILGAMEQTCVKALAPLLGPGEMTVGVSVSLEHLAPTPLGDSVTYEVEITRHGRRFDVEFVATDSTGTVVSKGRHQRALVERTKFLQRLQERRS